jgi:hypothetical protein
VNQQASHEQSNIDVRRAVSSSGFDGAKPVRAIRIGGRSSESKKVWIDLSVFWIGFVIEPTCRIRLPNLEHRVWHGLTVTINDMASKPNSCTSSFVADHDVLAATDQRIMKKWADGLAGTLD